MRYPAPVPFQKWHREGRSMHSSGQYEQKTRLGVQVFLILLAIVFVCYGVFRGEVESVFTKAIRLCLECVGIG